MNNRVYSGLLFVGFLLVSMQSLAIEQAEQVPIFTNLKEQFKGLSYTITWKKPTNLASTGIIYVDKKNLSTNSSWTPVYRGSDGGSKVYFDAVGDYKYIAYACNRNGTPCSKALGVNIKIKPVPTPSNPIISADKTRVYQGEEYNITWTGSTNLVNGKIYIDEENSGTTKAIYRGQGTKKIPFKNKPVGRYKYLAYACNAGAPCSSTSGVNVIVEPIPTPSTPVVTVNKSIVHEDEEYLIGWENINNIISRLGGEVIIEELKQDSTSWSIFTTSTSTGQKPTKQLLPGKYKYRATACNKLTFCSSTSLIKSVEVKPAPVNIVLTAVALAAKEVPQPSEIGSIKLSWNNVGSIPYTVFEYANIDGVDLLNKTTKVFEDTLTLANRFNNGGYKYRVCDAKNICSDHVKVEPRNIQKKHACIKDIDTLKSLKACENDYNYDYLANKPIVFVLAQDLISNSKINIDNANITIVGDHFNREIRYSDGYELNIIGANVSLYGFKVIGPNNISAITNKCERTIGINITPNAINTTVEELEIQGWTNGILAQSTGNRVIGNFIHNNNISHEKTSDCNKKTREGYGITTGSYNPVSVHVEYNLFKDNRHDIAGGGHNEHSYTAKNNFITNSGTKIDLSYSFDMHSCGDQLNDAVNLPQVGDPGCFSGDYPTLPYHAGDNVSITNNIWFDIKNYNGEKNVLPGPILIRGLPSGALTILGNYFDRARSSETVREKQTHDGLYFVYCDDEHPYEPKSNVCWSHMTENDSQQVLTYSHNYQFNDVVPEDAVLQKGKNEFSQQERESINGTLTLSQDINGDGDIDKLLLKVVNGKPTYTIHFQSNNNKSTSLTDYLKARYRTEDL